MRRINADFVQAGIVMLALSLASGCMKPVYLTAADSDRQVVLKKGQTVAISLEANPTTGYTWELAECDQSVIVRQVEPSYAASRPTRAGSGGLESWRFRAKAKGETEVLLVYRRPWEEKDEPERTFGIRVVVH